MPSIANLPASNLSASVKAPRLHIGWLDSLRALAALYVLLGHAISVAYKVGGNFHGLSLLFAAPFRYGHSAVGLFIVLSGFSLMIPVSRKHGDLNGGAWQFFGRRAKRILPTYYSAVGLSLLLIYFFIHSKTGTSWDGAIPVTKASVWTHLMMLQDIYSRAQINPALWSISVEWRIYFLFPLLVLLFKKMGGFSVSIGMLACSVIVFLAFQHTIFNGIMPAYFFLFTVGMLACEIGLGHNKRLSELRDNFPWLVAICIVFLVLTGLLLKWRANVSPYHLFLQDIATGLFSGLLLIMSQPKPNRLREILSWRPLVFIGTFAYSIYLIHYPLLQVVWQIAVRPFHKTDLSAYLILALIGMPLIVGASYLFFLAFERPFLNTKKHETTSELERDAALSPAP